MKLYSLAALASLSMSALAHADSTETFDFTLALVPAGQNSPQDFTGTLTFDMATGQLISGASGQFTNFISSPLGSIGSASASFPFGATPAESDTLSFGWSDPLGIAEVTPITFGNYVAAADRDQHEMCSTAGAPVCVGSHLIRESATAAPEIDANSAASALALLAGLFAVIRGRAARPT